MVIIVVVMTILNILNPIYDNGHAVAVVTVEAFSDLQE